VASRPAEARLAARVAGMLFRPARTLEAIEAEPTDPRGLYTGYLIPLAGLAAICGMIGVSLFGYGVGDIRVQSGLATTLIEGLARFLLTLVSAGLVASAIALVAPGFGGRRDFGQALKLVAHAGTAFWLAGVFGLVPNLGLVAGMLGALHGLYALFLGLPRLMKVRPEAALSCFAVCLAIIVLTALAADALAGRAADLGEPLWMLS
jgi:hypothetical protein